MARRWAVRHTTRWRASAILWSAPADPTLPTMPLFDYRCSACGHQFEALVLKGKEPEECAACGARGLERLLSLPAVKSESTHARAMAAAKRRDTAQAKDQAHEQRKYELSHDD